MADLLEGEFDPEEYDKRMAAAFGDGYYQVGGGVATWKTRGRAAAMHI